MELIKALQKHVQVLSKYQGVSLDKEIKSFILENSNIGEVELLDKIYNRFGTQIKFLEDASHCKAIINIKEWVVTFGVFFMIGLIAMIVSTLTTTMVK